jgi:hypothetical protein
LISLHLRYRQTWPRAWSCHLRSDVASKKPGAVR